MGTSNNAGFRRVIGYQCGLIAIFECDVPPARLPYVRPSPLSKRFERTPPSCGGDPPQRHKAANVVVQVLQANLGARPHDADRAHDPTTRRGLLSSEHMFDAGANFAPIAVCFRLRVGERVVASAALMMTALEAPGSKLRLDLCRAIGAVGEHLRRRVALVQEPIQLLAVVDRRIGHLVAPDQLVLGIRIHVVLVPEKTLAVLLRPARVAILLAQFGRLVVPRLRYPSGLHRRVLVTTVALPAILELATA